MEKYFELGSPLDSRVASWLKSSTPATVGYLMNCGMSLPERKHMPHGRGPEWQSRAIAAVLRRCYRRELDDPTLEEVEVLALSVLPEPEDDDRPRPPGMPSVKQRWEEAIRTVSERAYRILRYGPASGTTGGETLFTGGELVAELDGLKIQQDVDLVWCRPDGRLEAVLIFEEQFGKNGPESPADDWRCVLAAAVVRCLYGQNPDIHVVWVAEAAARVARVPDAAVNERLAELGGILKAARAFEGLAGMKEEAFYRLVDEPDLPPESLRGPREGRSRDSGLRRRR